MMISLASSMSAGLVPSVSNHLSRSLLSLDVEDSLRDAARLLRKARITGAPVIEDGSLAGILSRNDLLRKISSDLDGTDDPELFEEKLKRIQEEDVYEIMAEKPRTILPSATLLDAAQIMATNKLNRLMVKAKFGAMLGIISSTDVVFAMLGIDAVEAQGLDTATYQWAHSRDSGSSVLLMEDEECSLTSLVRDHMATDLTVVSPSMTLKEAGTLLRAARVTGAPVVDQGKLVGVLSRNDLLKRLDEIPSDASGEEYLAAVDKVKRVPVGEVMSANPITIRAGRSMLEAAKIMASERLNRLIVTDKEGGELTGLLSSTDVCFAMLGCHFSPEELEEGLDDIDLSKRAGNLYRKGIY